MTSNTYELLPTGKPHISFSELNDWVSCSYRHKLKHIDKIDLSKKSPIPDFGTAVHAACENYLRTGTMDTNIAITTLDELWEKNEHNTSSLEQFKNEAEKILVEVPSFIDTTFPGWKYIDAEHQLYESIEGHKHAFKGYIDGVISAKGARGKDLIWLLDWKTTTWGWTSDKKSDKQVTAQLVFYKNFWAKKVEADPKNVRCGFILLKRTAKPGLHCEFVPVSVGDVTTARQLTVVNNMLTSVKRGIAVKNRYSCEWCEYKGTKHCP
jgi:hypothetical protein